MARYTVHRLKETQREQFRWAPHTGGLAAVKPKDYVLAESLQTTTAYAAWKELQSAGRPLHPGDVLEVFETADQPGKLLIAKYIGFEPAEWYVPDPKPVSPETQSEEAKTPVD